MNNHDYHIAPFGENGWIATYLGNQNIVDKALFANSVADNIRSVNGIIDAVAGIDSVTIKFNPSILSAHDAHKRLEQLSEGAGMTAPMPNPKIEIPVCYGGEYGPDLEPLCNELDLTQEAIIERHTNAPYRVLAVGFAPGFAYLGPTDQILHCNRHKTPRPQVPAGSVGIAGSMTGVYPLQSPGGWQIIGRTPATLFDPDADQPFIFTPGTEVHFKPVDAKTFSTLEGAR
ncbi:5-oxoprolinase subunit PxpB [Hyphococcus lacteus]|uniref:5-oxoprolinase subunit PxpB n=1 Tax=Hyphococcus lacteus TaxID=3143536 RepID=A0ABV3Z2G8_9PROT